MTNLAETRLWKVLRDEALVRSGSEPVLASFLHASILNHASLRSALAYVLAVKLQAPVLSSMLLRQIISEAMTDDAQIVLAVCSDLQAHRSRDPACDSFLSPFLNYKGFHALQSYRIAHWLWRHDRKWLAYLLQNRSSSIFDVDIHPAAELGRGIMIDHGTGIVIGETARVGDNVSMLHGVSLGGTGCREGVRHPWIGDGVLISAGAKLMGPIQVGKGAKIGAGSLVLDDVPAHTTVVGVPAREVGIKLRRDPALDMDQSFGEMDIV